MRRRILLALDNSAAGQVALSFTISLADEGTAVRVVHVNELQAGGRGVAVESRQEAARLVDDAIGDLLSSGVEATSLSRVALSSAIADQIVAEAARWSADTIVLGSHRRRGLSRLLGQGVRDRVIRLTHLPVLTAPAPLTVLAPDLAGHAPQSRPGADTGQAR